MGLLQQMPLRLPAQLHDRIKRAAKNRGMSLNQYCLYILTRDCDQDPLIATQQAERTLTFIAQSQSFQRELDKKRPKHSSSLDNPQTPWNRYRELYVKS